MKTIFTQEDLVRYIYKETGITETQAIKTALESNWHLKEELEEMQQAKALLNTVAYNPAQIVVNKILGYSRMQFQMTSTK